MKKLGACTMLIIATVCIYSISAGLCFAGEKDGVGAVGFQGVIVNMEGALKYINPESYIQLLYLPDNGGISFETDNKGRTVFDSDLPTTPFSSHGQFKLKANNLKHGRYIMVGQKMEPYGLGSRVKPILSYMNSGQVIIIQHPTDTKGKKVLSLGDVIIPVPVK